MEEQPISDLALFEGISVGFVFHLEADLVPPYPNRHTCKDEQQPLKVSIGEMALHYSISLSRP